jgi:hypothetical protein
MHCKFNYVTHNNILEFSQEYHSWISAVLSCFLSILDPYKHTSGNVA